MRNSSVFMSTTCLLSVVWACLQPVRASADSEITLTRSGITVVGAYSGRAWAVTLSLLGCSWRALGPAPLEESHLVRGTSDDDTIDVLQNGLLWCNRWLQPIAQNGHSIQVRGGGGDDRIYGGGSAPFSGNPNSIFGEDGDDVLYAGPGGVRVEGGPGDDVIYGGDSPGDVLIGDQGDDVLCEQASATPLALEGGDGEDVACSPQATTFTNIESVRCNACGLAY